MGIFARISNLWKGFWSSLLGDVEKDNPELVYQAAIDARKAQYQKLMKAVSGIVYLRNKLEKDLEDKTRELTDVTAQIPVAVQTGEEEAAVHLIERKNALSQEIEYVRKELESVSAQADEAKSSLVSFQSEIEKLQAERETMLAKREHARARLKIQEQLSGLSTEADIRALDGVRESIHKLEAQADVAKEVQGAGMQGKLKKIREQTGSAAARAELEEIERQMAQGQQNIEKTL
ncbi:MAG: PspA/IM30 family protein [Candidatus Sericytochromatia bacterium]